MSVSIRDVARLAGVSLATVSRVFNGTGPVQADTRRKVLDVVERLGYVPHSGARSLITRQTRTIGVILPDIYGEFFSELIRGADLAARRSGYHLLVSGAHGDDGESPQVLRALHGRVDGLIVMAPGVTGAIVDRSLPGGLPAIMLNRAPTQGAHGSIRVDNRGGGRAMTEHLIGLGHTRIAMVLGPRENEDAMERHRGYRQALEAAGLPLEAELVLPGDFTDEAGYRAGQAIAALSPRPTAVFAANDAMALGCLAGLRDSGVRVPDDVALAGFDDIPFSRYVTPPLTTVRVAIYEFGSLAATRLIELCEGTVTTPRHEVLPTSLVVRESCGASKPGRPGLTQATRSATPARATRRRAGAGTKR